MTVAMGILAVLFIGAWYVLSKSVGGQFDSKIKAIAQAIAKAEGFSVAGSIPQRAHNPGDLKLGDVGAGTINGITIFPDDNAGWQALYNQVTLMVKDNSANYGPGDTWRDIAQTWVATPDANNWMLTVCNYLGVTPDSTLGDYYAV